MAEKKPDKAYPSQFDKVKEITDKLEAGIQALFESEAFKNYLKTLSKFHDYSLNAKAKYNKPEELSSVVNSALKKTAKSDSGVKTGR